MVVDEVRLEDDQGAKAVHERLSIEEAVRPEPVTKALTAHGHLTWPRCRTAYALGTGPEPPVFAGA